MIGFTSLVASAPVRGRGGYVIDANLGSDPFDGTDPLYIGGDTSFMTTPLTVQTANMCDPEMNAFMRGGQNWMDWEKCPHGTQVG